MLSMHTGYDTAYLTDAVGNGTAATDYYTAAAGEPPGYWQGAGAQALGLAGKVDAEVMRRLYHEDVGPDGQVLVRRQKPGQYPAAGGSLYERIDAAVDAQVAALGRFATPEEVQEQMGCEIGSCYPLGVVAGLRTLVDKSLARSGVISFNPGRHTVSIKLNYVDYQRLAQPELADVVQ